VRISLIAALARNRVIGVHNTLPWRLSEDLKRFKTITMGHTLLLGRKTFESIGRPLPGRTSIVLTRQPSYAVPPGVLTAPDLRSALELATGSELFVAGGAEIYALALPFADRLLLTRIDADYEGDAYFPRFDPAEWQMVSRESPPSKQDPEPAWCFETYERRRPTG
jgi:dihydrofolate reductase